MADAGEHDETHGYSDAAEDEALAVAIVLHKVQIRECAGDVDSADDDLRDVAVRHPRGGENGRTVIEEEVGPGQLLEREDGDAM